LKLKFESVDGVTMAEHIKPTVGRWAQISKLLSDLMWLPWQIIHY